MSINLMMLRSKCFLNRMVGEGSSSAVKLAGLAFLAWIFVG